MSSGVLFSHPAGEALQLGWLCGVWAHGSVAGLSLIQLGLKGSEEVGGTNYSGMTLFHHNLTCSSDTTHRAVL